MVLVLVLPGFAQLQLVRTEIEPSIQNRRRISYGKRLVSCELEAATDRRSLAHICLDLPCWINPLRTNVWTT